MRRGALSQTKHTNQIYTHDQLKSQLLFRKYIQIELLTKATSGYRKSKAGYNQNSVSMYKRMIRIDT